MGFWSEYFSTILKGIRVTAAKKKWETRRIVRNLKKGDHILYKSLFTEVTEKHLVTKAMKDEEKLLQKNLRIAATNAERLMFNVEGEELTLLKIINEILKEIEQFPHFSNKEVRKMEKELLDAILMAMQESEGFDRKEYLQVELIIKLAEEHQNSPSTFMQNVRLAFQDKKSQTILARFAARTEIRRIEVDLLALEKIPKQIRQLSHWLTESEKKGKNVVEDTIRELYVEKEKIKKLLREAFIELFLLMHRDTLWMVKILVDLNNLFNFNTKWVGESWLPRNAVEKKHELLFKLEEKIAEEFHKFAQGFRIIIAKLRELEKRAEADERRL